MKKHQFKDPLEAESEHADIDSESLGSSDLEEHRVVHPLRAQVMHGYGNFGDVFEEDPELEDVLQYDHDFENALELDDDFEDTLLLDSDFEADLRSDVNLGKYFTNE